MVLFPSHVACYPPLSKKPAWVLPLRTLHTVSQATGTWRAAVVYRVAMPNAPHPTSLPLKREIVFASSWYKGLPFFLHTSTFFYYRIVSRNSVFTTAVTVTAGDFLFCRRGMRAGFGLSVPLLRRQPSQMPLLLLATLIIYCLACLPFHSVVLLVWLFPAQASAVSDDRCPFPGLRCLRLETVGRAHYLCYTSRSSR